MSYGCIYKVTNIQDKKVYIGQTINFESRKKGHIHAALEKFDNNKKSLFYYAIRKYREQNFKWEILGYCETREELNEAEIECIWFFQSQNRIYGYNITSGGNWGGYPGEYNGMYGKKHSEESKQKNRESNIGKKHSEESKRKMSKSRIGLNTWTKGTISPFKGKKHSEESKQKKREAHLGKIPSNKGSFHTEETKQKMKENHANVSGKNNPMYGISLYGEDNGMCGKKHSDEAKQKMKNTWDRRRILLKEKTEKQKQEDIENIKALIDLGYNNELIAQTLGYAVITIHRRKKLLSAI